LDIDLLRSRYALPFSLPKNEEWGLFSNTALDTFVQNVAEPPVKKVNNSRAILNFLNQGAGTFWANGAKPVFGNSPVISKGGED